MIVSNNTNLAIVSGDFFNSFNKKGHDAPKKVQENFFRNPGGALENAVNVASALASRDSFSNIVRRDKIFSYRQRITPS